MRIGTTPTHIFKVEFDENMIADMGMIADVEIAYCQDGKEILRKHMDDCELDGDTITTKLSQEETFKFAKRRTAEIQIRAVTTDGTVTMSNVVTMVCEKCLFKEVVR